MGEGRPGFATPGHGFLGDERGEEIDLLFEQFLILREFVTEERKGFGERAAPQDNFGPAVRNGVQC
jgi:hypothetical protein